MDKKLRIGYIIKYFHPIKGGAESYMLNLALQAARDGHEVHVFTSDRKGKEVLKERDQNYKRIQIHRCKNWFDLTHYLSFSPSLLMKFLRANFDVVHASGFGFIWHDVILLLKKLASRGTKFINTPHGPFMALNNYNPLLKLVKSSYTSIQRLFLDRLYDVVLADNTFQWQWIVTYGIKREKIKFIPVGIPSHIIEKKVTFNQLKDFTQRNDIQEKIVISYLGRIAEYKGIHYMLEILPKLVRRYPNIVFLIMGRDDGYLRKLKAKSEKLKVRQYVRFIEDISEEEKLIALEKSDIFVFLSEWEAFGIVMVEAMSRGNAVISTKTEGGKFLVMDGVNGFHIEFQDTRQLHEVMSKLLEDPELLTKMKRENREKAKRFIWNEIYKDYKMLLESLI